MLLLEKKKQHKDLVLFFPKWEFRTEKNKWISSLSLTQAQQRKKEQEEKKGF
jgi:hypothetical protein